jgi:glucose-1-phosphate cytidylyltransferase
MSENLKVVILCGGKGTRSYPFTEYFPKVMMPVNGTPILVHLMRTYAAQGFKDFVLAGGHRIEMLYDYFNGRFQEWNVKIVDTGDDADTGDRIIRCGAHVGERFFATYGDGLADLDLRALVANHKRYGGLATLTTVPLRSQYGLVVFGADDKVQRFEEKPLVADYWINAGFFVFEKAALEDWKGHNLEQDVLPDFARRGKLFVNRHKGFFKSMDTSKDQAELEKLCVGGALPWVMPEAAVVNR